MTPSITKALLNNRFDRRVIAPGTVGWIYEYTNRSSLPIPKYVSSALELGVQLSGEWFHTGSRSGARLFTRGMIHTISPAERFTYAFKAPRHQTSSLVGFTVYPDEVAELGGTELAFAPRAATADARLLELCRAIHDADARDEQIAPSEICRELYRFLRDNCEPVRADALHDAKRAIDETYDRALYLHHIADVAGMHPTTFSRAFIARHGMSPTRYRLELRLNEAVRLSWSRPDLSIRAIANEVGFDDLSYFHRVFMRKFGMTPAQLGRRTTAND